MSIIGLIQIGKTSKDPPSSDDMNEHVKPRVLISDTTGGEENTLVDVLDKNLKIIDTRSISRIIIKPNLMDPTHSPGVTISPAVLEKIAGHLRNRFTEVVIVEGGGYNLPAKKMLDGHDVWNICKRTGAVAFDLCDLERVMLTTESRWNSPIRFPFPKILLDKDSILISLACMKTHVFTGISLSIKNLWGCIPDTKRTLFHAYINEILPKIVDSIPNPIALIDGDIALDGRGPKLGTPFKGGIVISSTNLLAADIAATRVMGISPMQIRHLERTIQLTDKLKDFNDYEIEMLGSAKLDRIMKTTRTWYDAIAIVTYWSPYLSKLFYDSRLTPIIQAAVLKTGLSPGAQN